MLNSNIIIENEFLIYVSDELQRKYGLSEEKAKELVKNSFVGRMIHSDPDYIMHYDAEDLADDIMKDIN